MDFKRRLFGVLFGTATWLTGALAMYGNEGVLSLIGVPFIMVGIFVLLRSISFDD